MALLSCKFSNTEMPHLNIQNVCLHRMIRTSLSWFLSTNRCSFTHQNICERFMCDSIDSMILCIRSRAVDSMKPVFWWFFSFQENQRKGTSNAWVSINIFTIITTTTTTVHNEGCFIFLPSSISVVTTSQIRIDTDWVVHCFPCYRHQAHH